MQHASNHAPTTTQLLSVTLSADDSGHVRSASRSAAQILGRTPDELAGLPLAEVLSLPGDDIERVRADASAHAPWRGPATLRLAGGEPVALECRVAAAPAGDGTLWVLTRDAAAPAMGGAWARLGIGTRMLLANVMLLGVLPGAYLLLFQPGAGAGTSTGHLPGALTLAGLVALALLLSHLLLGRILRGESAALAASARALAGDPCGAVTGSERGDELAAARDALGELQVRLAFAHTMHQDDRDQSQRLLRALDSVSANVMVADENHDVVYLNDAMVAFFEDNKDQLRRRIPGFEARKLVGRSMDAFDSHPGHQRTLIDALRSGRHGQARVEDLFLEICASPVLDSSGERRGTAVVWRDLTAERMFEQELQAMVDAAKSGDLSTRLALENKAGFHRTLSEGINELVDVSERAIQDTSRVLEGLAHGDFTQTIESDYQGRFGKLRDDANEAVLRLKDVISSIKTGAECINDGTGEISQGNADLSRRTEQQAASLQQTASSMEEMTAIVRRNAENAQKASELSNRTCEQAERGGMVVHNAVRAMQEIDASSQKIADIIGVIDEIAFQTNLLALNAAVEAARAGEQGRGFAVVASEVRNLAQRSASAAKEIKDLIEDSVDKVASGSKLVDESGETLNAIVTSIQKVSGIVAQISNASQEQSEGIDQVNSAISQMDTATQHNAALVEQAAAASETMSEQAAQMHELVSFFRMDAAAGDETAHDTAVQSRWPGPERRGPGRPWREDAAPSAPVKTVHQASGTDDEWEEF